MNRKIKIGLAIGAGAVIAAAALGLSGVLRALPDYLRPSRYELKTYLVQDGEPHPFAVICPGGAYGAVCSFAEGEPYAKALNERGYHTFVLYYRVRKDARYPNPQDDLERAVTEILAHADEWKVEPDGWSLWGSSAGGHLAASFCAEDRDVPKPAALVLCYPVVTMGKKTHAVSRKNLLGNDPEPGLADRLSVELNVDSDYPPTFLWYGTADKVVDPENSRMLDAALARADVRHETAEYEGVGHGVGLASGTAAEEWFDKAVAFWEEQARGAEAG
ncbi:MAG: alpha/beta hydrolase [Clostridia bacterium]|nr:alpha/beta hydrolase [Clostridia bacterium]